MKTYIEKCFERNEIASLYQESGSGHLTGFISAFDDEAMVIGHITPDGFYDGYVLLHISDVIRMDFGGKYEEKIKKLYQLKNQNHNKLPVADSAYASALQYAVDNQLVVSLDMGEDLVFGFILDYSEEYIHLQMVDEFGESTGESVVQCEYAKTISIDTTREQSIKMLINHF